MSDMKFGSLYCGSKIHPDETIDLNETQLNNINVIVSGGTIYVKNVTVEKIQSIIENWTTLFGSETFKPVNLYFDAMFDDGGFGPHICYGFIVLSHRCQSSSNLANVISVISSQHNLFCDLK